MDIKSLFMKQKMMRTVLLSLVPLALAAVFLFGWRLIMLAVLVALTAALAEYLVMRSISGNKAKVSEAVFVSAALFTLSLPPQTPVWIALAGIVFGIVFGKAVFGGFGRNIFNPALVGRCFIYIAFPHQMTMSWAQPFLPLPGGFASWTAAADAVTSATPIITYNTSGTLTPPLNLFLGIIAGSMGETSALLILLAGIFLVYKKVASWQLMVSTVVSGTLLSAVLHYAGVTHASGMLAAPPLFALLSGGFLFGAVFMVTDPVSAPKSKEAKWIAGSLVGLITVVIRTFSLFTEGMMFAILIVNALTPLIELQVKKLQPRVKQPEKEAAP
jgi:Na+-transporting NADH:ubiquinone oxidoreductase subunit B